MAKNPHAVALGRKGGSATSDAKIKAAKANGKKGGRPKKQKPDADGAIRYEIEYPKHVSSRPAPRRQGRA